MRPSVRYFLALTALAASAGCFGGESLGDHKPAGSGGTGASSTGGANGPSGTGGTSSTVGAGGSFATGGDGGDTFTTGGGGTVGAGGVTGSAGGVTGSAGGVTGSAGGTGGDVGGSGGAAQFCGSVASYAEPAHRSDILIVMDRSSSMSDDSNETVCTGGCGPSSKFEVLSAALDQLVYENPSVNWGLAFFPTDDACGVTAGVAVDPSPNAPPTIESTLPTMMPGGGDAPTAAAIYAASAYLESRVDMNRKYILLATDGRSGCATGDGVTADVEAENAITSALVGGIPTYVLGIAPRSDITATATLNQMADLGGEPAQGTAGDFLTIADLGPSFAPATSSALSCSLYLPFPIGPGTTLQVQALTGGGSVWIDVPEDPSNGWSFTSPNLDGVILNGSACTSTMDGSYNQFQLYYSCSGPPLLEDARPVGER